MSDSNDWVDDAAWFAFHVRRLLGESPGTSAWDVVVEEAAEALRVWDESFRTCDRCGQRGRGHHDMTRNGEPAVLGTFCGCYERWLHYRELWEFEATGVIKR